MTSKQPKVELLIAWRHLRGGDRVPSWVKPLLWGSLYLLLIGLGFVVYAIQLSPDPIESAMLTEFEGFTELPTVLRKGYYGLFGAASLLVGSMLALIALISRFFKLLAMVIIVSVMLGCMALVTVLSLMSGLEVELRSKILDQRAHMTVVAKNKVLFADYLPLTHKIQAQADILGASPYVEGELMVRSESNRQGGILLGVLPEYHRQVANVPQIMIEGTYDFLDKPQDIPEPEFSFEVFRDQVPTRKPKEESPSKAETDIGQGIDLDKLPVPDFDEPKLATTDLKSALKAEGWEDPVVELKKSTTKKKSLNQTKPEDGEWEDPKVELEQAKKNAPVETPKQVSPEPANSQKTAIVPVILGHDKAKELAVHVGDQVQLITPLGSLTPAGRIPGVMAAKVAGVFNAEYYEYDRWLVYAPLQRAQAVLRAGNRVSGIEIKVKHPLQVEKFRQQITQLLEAEGRSDLEVKDWKQLNSSLFSAMELEKIAAFIALLSVILVASFGILGSNLMSVLEKAKEIAILKTMGCSDGQIRRIFILEGLAVGILGSILGISVGIILCFAVHRYGLPLSGNLSVFERLPVKIYGPEVLLVAISVLIIVWLSSLYPASVAARMRPADSLRQLDL